MKPIILAIETATDACSAALVVDQQIYCRYELAPKAHTDLILPMIRALLLEANLALEDITALAVGRGPGSFTGVRIAISLAQGMAYGLNVPVYPVSTLEALARQALERNTEKTRIIPALDARMSEIYTAVYDGMLNCIVSERVCSPQDLCIAYPHHNILAIGSGWDAYPDRAIPHIPHCHPQAKHIAQIALQQINQGLPGLPAEKVLPIYLRDNVAKRPSAVN